MISTWSLRIANSLLMTGNAEVTDLSLPKIVREFDTDRRVGYAGSVPIPTGFGEMDLSFSTTQVTESFYTILASLGEVSFLFTGAELVGSSYNIHTIACFGYVEELPIGEFDATTSTYEVTAKISRIETKINNNQVILFSPKTNEYYVNGINQMVGINSVLFV